LSSANQPKSAPIVELISVPNKPGEGKQTSFFDDVLGGTLSTNNNVAAYVEQCQQIRQEELLAMYYEDERRKMVQSESRIAESLHISQHLFDEDKASSNNYSGGLGNTFGFTSPGMHGKQKIPTSFSNMEIEQSLNFLSQTKTVILHERAIQKRGRELNITLMHREEVEGPQAMDCSRASGDVFPFTWAWSEVSGSGLSTTNGTSNIDGYVNVPDIEQVSRHTDDQSVVVITLVESARAIKNARGRTMLLLRGINTSESDQLFFAVSCIAWTARNLDQVLDLQ
jgi:hypothetical protein